ncbi:MAG TPA: hypothetical protein VK741_19740 [Acetobacteraceae bacterium]|jgi:hypothetical protein|nr:hypothetical protein [Acetobacteraceae bacterium]
MRPVPRYLAVLATVMVAGFALVWAWVAAMPLAYLDPEYPVWRAKLAMLRHCDIGDVLLVGDSRLAVDVIPALLPVKATNLALGGGMPIETYIVAARALTCPVPPRRVVISLGAPHFATPDLFWERSVKFGFVTSNDLALLRRLSRETGDAALEAPKAPDGLPSALRGWLYQWRFPSLYFSSLVKGRGFLRLWHNEATFAMTLAARGQAFFGLDAGSSSVAAEGHMDAFVPLPVLDRYFDRMLALLAARGIPADFIAMPMNQTTGNAVLPAVRDGFAAYLARYEARYPLFHVIGPPMPAWPDRYFGDEFSHLNPEGAALLSMPFGRCLQGGLVEASSVECVPAVVE